LLGAVQSAVAAPVAPNAVACSVDYAVPNDWGVGFTAYLRVTNLGDPISGWTLTFAFPGNQRITQGWSANWSQPSGSPNVSATNLDWNRNLATGQYTDIGFNASYTGTNARPASFAINGTTCTGANRPPTVSLTQPASGASFDAGVPIPMAANAADPDGTVGRVEFYTGSTLLGTDTTSPYQATWTSAPAGNHVLPV